jgi:hypothetical protein
VVGSIVQGSVIYQIEGQPESTLKPGDVFYEPEGARIARFDATEEGATFLGYFILAAGEEPQINLPDQPAGLRRCRLTRKPAERAVPPDA